MGRIFLNSFKSLIERLVILTFYKFHFLSHFFMLSSVINIQLNPLGGIKRMESRFRRHWAFAYANRIIHLKQRNYTHISN